VRFSTSTARARMSVFLSRLRRELFREAAVTSRSMPPREIKAPQPIPEKGRAIFLAGSIENGAAAEWQRTVVDALADLDELLILNPRREDWDASWKQSIDDPRFKEQVEWELDGLERADLIAMHFAPETKSPISLLELGLHARSGRMIVSCPPGFWRRGNVEIVCDRYGVTLVTSLEELIVAIREELV
jgi:hypothetical protein